MKDSSKLNLSLSRFLKKQYPDSYKFNQMLVQKGIANASIISEHMYRSWPFWISKQLKPDQTPHISDMNLLGLINTKHRNWTYISNPNSDNAAIIDPAGLIYVKGKSYSIDLWISNSNSLFIPSHKDDIRQQYLPESNSVLTSFSLSQLDIESHVMFNQLPSNLDFVFCNYKLTNNTKKNIKFSFYIAIRPFDFEGVTDIQSIQYLQDGIFMVDKQLGIVLDKQPDNIVCLAHHEGDVSEHFNKLEMIFNASCPLKKVSAFAEYRLVIAPNKDISLTFKIPCMTRLFPQLKIPFLNQQSPSDLVKNTYQSFTFDKSLKELSFYNSDLRNQDMSFSFPDSHLTHFIHSQFSFLISSIHTNSFKHGYYQELNHSLFDHLFFMNSLYIAGYKPSLYSHMFSVKYLNKVYSQLKSQQLSFTDCSSWFENLLGLFNSNVITITHDMYKVLFKIIMLGLNQFKFYDDLEFKTLPARSTSKHQTSFFLSDVIGLFGCLHFFKLLSQKLPYGNLDIVNNANLNHYSALLEDSIETFCSVVSNKIALNNVVPVSSTQYISLDLIKTLSLYVTFFPNKNNYVKNTILNIQKHLAYNQLIFSMINPSGFPLSYNLDYIQLLIKLDPKNVFNIITKLLSYATSTFTFPDTIHPITKGGSEGDGHTIKHGVLLAQYIFDTILYQNDKNLILFPAIPAEWLANHSWHLNNYKIGKETISLSIKQSPTETTLDITFSNKKLFSFFMIHTHSHYKSFILNDTEIAIKSPTIKIPGSETCIRLIKHDVKSTF